MKLNEEVTKMEGGGGKPIFSSSAYSLSFIPQQKSSILYFRSFSRDDTYL